MLDVGLSLPLCLLEHVVFRHFTTAFLRTYSVTVCVVVYQMGAYVSVCKLSLMNIHYRNKISV